MTTTDEPNTMGSTEAAIETGTEDLLGHRIGHVAVLTFNRPERRNAPVSYTHLTLPTILRV